MHDNKADGWHTFYNVFIASNISFIDLLISSKSEHPDRNYNQETGWLSQRRGLSLFDNWRPGPRSGSCDVARENANIVMRTDTDTGTGEPGRRDLRIKWC